MAGTGFFFESVNSLKLPRSGTFLRFFTPEDCLALAFRRCKVFPFFSGKTTKGLGKVTMVL